MIRCSRYLSGLVGPRLRTVQEVRKYLEKEVWSVQDEFRAVDGVEHPDVSSDDVYKLLKLSGLPSEDADVPAIKKRLSEQLRFIGKLHQGVTGEINVAPPQHGEKLTLADIQYRIDNITRDPSKGEPAGSWDTQKLADISQDGYFVVREGLMKGR